MYLLGLTELHEHLACRLLVDQCEVIDMVVAVIHINVRDALAATHHHAPLASIDINDATRAQSTAE